MNGSTTFDHSAPATLAERIVKAREATGFTTAQLAHRLGVRTSTLASWESGKGEPRTNRLMMLAGLLSVSPTWLLCGRGTAPTETGSNQTGDLELSSLKTSLTELRSMITAMGEHVQNLEQRVDTLDRSG
jgi:transcriptional regulator with XRE-family HTH domain